MRAALAVDRSGRQFGPSALDRPIDRLGRPLWEWFPAGLADRLPADLADHGDDPEPYVCPFCGRAYAGPRQRCAGCGGVPIVRTDDCQVYAAIVGLCGPRYDPGERDPRRSHRRPVR